MCVKENATEPTDMEEMDKPQRPSSTASSLEDSWCPVADRQTYLNTKPQLTASTLLLRHPRQQQRPVGTTSLLTAHTASAQLKLHFSKQDAAAWEGEKSRFGLQGCS